MRLQNILECGRLPFQLFAAAQAVHDGTAGSGRTVLNIAEDGRPAAERHAAVEVSNPVFEQHAALAWVRAAVKLRLTVGLGVHVHPL